MNRITLIRDGEYYWIRDILTGEVSVGLCILKDIMQGAVFQEFGSSFRRSNRDYMVISHIQAPTETDINAILRTLEEEPGDPPKTDEEDWEDDGEWEQDIYDDEEDYDDDGDEDDDEFFDNEDPGR